MPNALTPLPRWQRVYLITCAWTIGYCLSYVAAQWGQWPKLTYFPLARSWELWASPPGPLPMSYLGLVLWGCGGGVVAAAAISLACTRLPALKAATLRLVGGWTLTSFAMSGLFFTWNLWPF